MGKPSIFSREYEKRMKKRRKNMIIMLVVIIALIGAVSAKFIYNPIDFSSIKQNIQAWIDSDTGSDGNKTAATEETQTEESAADLEEVEEIEEVPQNKSIDILINGKTAKGIYVEENNICKFIDLQDADENTVFDISPSGDKMLVMDAEYTITMYDLQGNGTVVSKDKYVSKSGSVFEKTTTMQNQPSYLWNSTPKFLSDSKIIFISNRPYFGTAAVKKYLWITDLTSGNDTVLWDLASENISIDGIVEGKMKVTVNGNVIYLDENGNKMQ